MEKSKKLERYVEKIGVLREAFQLRFPNLTQEWFNETMVTLAHYHYSKDRYFIAGQQKEVYLFLIENHYNPFTVYRWICLEKLPEDIKFRMNQGEMCQKEAISEGFKRRHETIQELGISVREAGLCLIRRM